MYLKVNQMSQNRIKLVSRMNELVIFSNQINTIVFLNRIADYAVFVFGGLLRQRETEHLRHLNVK